MKLAEEIVDGKVFGDWMLPKGNPSAVISTFMVLSFLEKEQKDKMIKNDVVAIYEHLSEAGHLCVNGFPIFSSCHFLTGEDVKVLNPMIEKLKTTRDQARKDILGKLEKGC